MDVFRRKIRMSTIAATVMPVGRLRPNMRQGDSVVADDIAQARVREAAEIDFSTLYRDYKRKVYGTVIKIVGSSNELDDIVQIVFMEIHRCLPKYRGGSQLSTWIYRVTVNVALQHIRKQKRKRVFLFFRDEERATEKLSFDVRTRYEQRDIMTRLYGLLDRITEKKRTVFVLHELEGVPLDQVAEICDIPVNTVRSRLHAARTELLAKMRKAGILENDNAV
jgi:RNA polymerase sigma-70 factor (ECF subfamily)